MLELGHFFQGVAVRRISIMTIRFHLLAHALVFFLTTGILRLKARGDERASRSATCWRRASESVLNLITADINDPMRRNRLRFM
jgi:hypothetical protein